MKPYRTLPYKANTPEWSDARKRLGIGASESAAAIGMSKYHSPFDVYSYHVGLSADLVQTEAMEFGHVLEPVVADVGSKRWGIPVRKGGRLLQSREYPWMLCTPDYFTLDGELVQIKTANVFAKDFGEEETEQVPDDYLIQELHEMAVTGAPRAHLWCLFGGQKLKRFLIERDEEAVAGVVERTRKLWQDHIVPRIPPAIDGSDGSLAYLSARYAETNGVTVAADDSVTELAEQYLTTKAEIDRLDAIKKALAAEIMNWLGENRAALGKTFKALWYPVKESTYTVHKDAGRTLRVTALEDA